MWGHTVCLVFPIICVLLIPSTNTIFYLDPVAGTVTANTPYGLVEGLTYRSQYEAWPHKLINVYRGIPYAKTLKQHGSKWRDKYRFHNPDEDPYWYGVYDATKHKPACPQMPWLVKETVWDFSEVDEDCLYLDIYTPNNTNESPTSSPVLYPVLVFFHGGGFIMGASKQWPGLFLAQRNLVVVIVNYRLNALGFLSTGDRYSPGNYGMFDQIKALQFVKKTIRSFRGNLKKVTLMGHNSGAASVGMHLLSPRSVGLFHRAIMLSGSELSEWAVIKKEDSLEYAKRLCRETACPTGDSQQMMDCLRHNREFEQIVNASAMVRMLPGKIGNPWAPVVDGRIVGAEYAFLTDLPYNLRNQVIRSKIPLLAGMVQDEGAYFIPNLPNLIDGITPQQFQNILNEFIRHRDIEEKNALFDALNFQYTYWPQPTNTSFIRKKVINMMTDYLFGAALSETIKWHVQFTTVYFYVFQYSSWNNYVPQWRGISHGQDLNYIFGLPFINETYMNLLNLYPRQSYDYSDRNISEYMINMISNFTSGGEPTPRTEHIHYFRNTSWFEYNLKNHSYLSIKNESKNMENYRQKEIHFWNDYYPVLAGYSPYYYKPKTTAEPSTASTYELTTWSLAAAAGFLLLAVIGLVVLLICRSRTKKYPKYDRDSTNDDRSITYCNDGEKDRRTEVSYFGDEDKRHDDHYNSQNNLYGSRRSVDQVLPYNGRRHFGDHNPQPAPSRRDVVRPREPAQRSQGRIHTIRRDEEDVTTV